MSNPWDEFDGAAGNFIPLAEFKAGQSVEGVILKIGAKRFDDKPEKAVPQLTMDLGDGADEPSTLTCGYVMLVSDLKKQAPDVGDKIKVTVTKIGPKPKEMREFAVETSKAGTFAWPPAGAAVPTPAVAAPIASTPAATPVSTPAPAAATAGADPLAGLTAEQRAALGLPPLAAADPLDSDPRVPALRAMGLADDAIKAALGI